MNFKPWSYDTFPNGPLHKRMLNIIEVDSLEKKYIRLKAEVHKVAVTAPIYTEAKK
jgi:hypothetical protein